MEETRTIILDKYDYKLMLNALNEFRNAKLQQNIDTEITKSGITITESYSLLEDIGEEKEIIFSNEKAEDKEE